MCLPQALSTLTNPQPEGCSNLYWLVGANPAARAMPPLWAGSWEGSDVELLWHLFATQGSSYRRESCGG